MSDTRYSALRNRLLCQRETMVSVHHQYERPFVAHLSDRIINHWYCECGAMVPHYYEQDILLWHRVLEEPTRRKQSCLLDGLL